MDLKNLDKETLEKILRKVVQEELGRKVGGFEKHIDKSGVGVVKIPSVKPERFDTGNPNDKRRKWKIELRSYGNGRICI